MDGAREMLTILGVEEHGFEEFGDLLEDEEEADGPVHHVQLPGAQRQEQRPQPEAMVAQDVSQKVQHEVAEMREPPGLSQPDPLGGVEPAALKFESWVKAAKMNVRRIGEVEITHNDVIGVEEDLGFLPYEDADPEDEDINKRLERRRPTHSFSGKVSRVGCTSSLR
jgi:hypothetical protein